MQCFLRCHCWPLAVNTKFYAKYRKNITLWAIKRSQLIFVCNLVKNQQILMQFSSLKWMMWQYHVHLPDLINVVTVLQYALEYIVDYRTITVRDLPYLTPPTRVLLRKRNKLLRHGKTNSVQLITIKIGKTIANVRSKMLSKATPSDTKQLWQLLHSTHNWSHIA